MTLAHHYATEHHQSGGGETVLFGTHQRHFYHIQTGFQLTVGLYFNTAPQVVQHQCLLHLGKASSTGRPACLMLLRGLAPVPPSVPLITIKSAWALATPAATVPTPLSDTSFTLMRAEGLVHFKSKISCAKSSIE